MFDTPLPEIIDKISHAMPPLPPIFPEPPAVEKTNAIAASIVGVQGEVAKFDAIAAGLAAIEAAHPKNVIVAAIDTSAGMKLAEGAWRAYRNPRLEVERARKAAKAPVLALGKAIDTFAGGLEDRLRAGEDHYKAQIDAENERAAAVKAEAARVEAARVAAHRAGIESIRSYLAHCQQPGMTAARIQAGIDILAAQTFDVATWEEFAVPAANAQCETLEAMRTLHAQTLGREQEAARQEAIRLENARVAAELAAERARIEAEAAEIRRQAAELAAQRAESERLERLAEENRARALAAELEAKNRAALAELRADTTPEIEAGVAAMLAAMPGGDPASQIAELAAEARASRFPSQPKMSGEWWTRFYAVADAMASAYR